MFVTVSFRDRRFTTVEAPQEYARCCEVHVYARYKKRKSIYFKCLGPDDDEQLILFVLPIPLNFYLRVPFTSLLFHLTLLACLYWYIYLTMFATVITKIFNQTIIIGSCALISLPLFLLIIFLLYFLIVCSMLV